MIYAAFLGLVAAVAIYHLLLYTILRARDLLSYGLYLGAFGVFQYARTPQLVALTPGVNQPALFAASFAALMFFGYWLLRTFLSLPQRQPQLHRFFLDFTLIGIILNLLPIPHVGWYGALVELAALGILTTGAAAIVIASRQGLRVAKYFGVAYAGLFIGALLHVAWLHVGAELGPLTALGEFGIELGTAFQALTLALGLADRIAAANEERDHAQRHTIEEISSLNEAYARFVPRAFLELLGKHDVRDVALGDGTEREMTVLFSDVRSFTTLSEAMTPGETFGFINDLLAHTGPVVREHGGTVDKYVGDAIMALFPGPTDDAVQAAIAIQRAVATHNLERAERGLPAVAVGVGLHRGSLMLGTIGEAERMDGTVIADAVNVASRVEGLTKEFHAPILITESVREALPDPERYTMRFLGRVAVKGKANEIGIYEVSVN